MSVHIEELALEGIEEFARFWAGPDFQPKAEKIAWLLRQSQRVDSAMPMGWIARSEGRIVAGKLCFGWPVSNGSETQVLAMSGFMRVDPEYAGMAGFIFKRYLALADRYALAATSTNLASSRLWKAFGGKPFPHSANQWMKLGNTRAATRERLTEKWGRARLASLAAQVLPERAGVAVPHPLTIAPLEWPSGERRIPSEASWTGARDRDFMRWRFEEAPEPRPQLFGSPEGSGYAVRFGSADHRPSMKVAQVLDWTPDGLDRVGDLDYFLSRHATPTRMDAVSIDMVPEGCQEALIRAGFKSRSRESALVWVIDPKSHLGGLSLDLRPLDSDLFA